MLKNHKLLVDQNCPLCMTYRKGFTVLGLLEEDCALPYQSEQAGHLQTVNQERARNEIAMVDTVTGETVYGLSSLYKILFQNHPLLEKSFHHPLIFSPLNMLYKFISHNRKVIAPPAPVSMSRPCIPDFHRGYRWAYILFVVIVTAIIVHNFTAILFPHFGWPHNFWTELCICIGQVVWQGAAAHFIARKKWLTYLGNMSTVSLMGALLLLPITLLLSAFNASIIILLICFFSVIGFMFFEHIRRCKHLGISSWMTVSWVAFRVSALSLLITLIHLNFL